MKTGTLLSFAAAFCFMAPCAFAQDEVKPKDADKTAEKEKAEEIEEVTWESDLDDALVLAKKSKKYVLLVIGNKR